MTNDANIADYFVGQAARFPDRVAIREQDDRLTYGALHQRTSKAARVLQRNGVVAGSRVGIAVSSSFDVAVLTFALWMIDATVCVVDFRSRLEEHNRITEAFGLTHIVQARQPAGRALYKAVIASEFWDEVDSLEDGSAFTPVRPRHAALIGMTSGTTGTPIGIVRNHGTFISLSAQYTGFGSSDAPPSSIALVQPLQFAAPFHRTTTHLMKGGSVHLLPFLASAPEIADYLLRHSIAQAFVVPSQLRGLLDISTGGRKPLLPDLKVLDAGGSMLEAQENIRAYRELTPGYAVSYASSLTGRIAALSGEDVERYPGSVGRLVFRSEISFVRSDGKPAETGESGLIRVRGPAVADDIVGVARAASDRFEDGWAIPGDLGQLDENGILTLTGRASDVIIRGGANVFPQEIEAILRNHPGIGDVAVAGIKDAVLGEEIVAFVVRSGDVKATELEEFCRRALAPDKRPRRFKMVDSLPYSGMGKVIRRKLVEDHFPE